MQSTGFIFRLRRGAVLALAAILFAAARADAAGATVFGPRTFTRATGTPVVERVSFPAPPGSYIVRIESIGTASAVVAVNGQDIAIPSQFTPSVKLLLRPVTLVADNTLSVELASEPGSRLRISIVKDESQQPKIVAAISPLPNAAGWSRADTTVSFTCTAAAPYPGTPPPAIASCTAPVKLTTEGARQAISGTAIDSRGNTVTITVTLNLDKTAPSIAPAIAPAPNTAGWHQTAPTVSFACGDTLSGLASCTPPQVVSQDGAGIVIPGKAVDIAGNEAINAATLNVDRIPPTIAAQLSAPVPPGGWFNAPVTITFVCADTGSGAADCPPAVTVSTDAVNRAIAGTVADRAGNAASVTQIVNVDVTAPQLVARVQPAAGPGGWHRGDVTVTFECTDAASGVLDCPQPRTIAAEGKEQSVSADVRDKAGNTGTASVLVSIDRSKPSIAASIEPAANADGWHNAPVTVTFTCGDALAGIATCPSPITVTADGAGQTISGTAVDNAGNSETAAVTLNVDLTPPSIAGTATAAGVSNGDVTVHFECSDTGSGIALCPPDQIVTTEGMNQTIVGTARDKAGNTAVATVVVSLDRTKPGIAAATAPAANAHGWHKTDVDITFTCSDSGSGVAQCPAPVHVDTEGAGQAFSGQARDNAGNAASVTTTINVDKTAPSIVAAASATGWTSGDVTVTFTCSDALSGIAGCPDPVVVSSGGAREISGTAIDKAGNLASASVQVMIDRTAPSVVAAPDRAANANGWYNAPVTVGFTCNDAESGVASCPAPVQLTAEGAAVDAGGTAADHAGNQAAASLVLRIDRTAPTIQAVTSPAPNHTVVVTFTCDDGLSGIDVCPAPQTVSGDGAHKVHAETIDRAGNQAAIDVDVAIDVVPPVVAAAATPPANAAGWHRTPVTVTFQCSDAGSGVAECPAPRLVDSDGAGQIVSGTAADKSGNTATASLTINLDRGAPALSVSSPADGAIVAVAAQRITGSAIDTLSGLQSITCAGTAASLGQAGFTCDVSLAAGPNALAIVATDKAGNSVTQTLHITLSGNHPPTAGPGGPYKGQTGQTVTFSGADSNDPDGDPLTYAWNFGDGSTGSGIQATHTYSEPGTFTVTLTVTDSNKTSGSATTTAVIARPNRAPTAAAGGPYSGDAGATIAFSASGSSDPDGDSLTYAWTFSDGGTATGVNPRRTYQTAGTFSATVTVSDGRGGSASATASITITAANRSPQAQIGGPYSSEAGTSISFSAAASSDPDGDALTYAWTFGDGTTAAGAAPSHAYGAAGTFTATVTVSDGRGGSSSASTLVAVTAANRAPSANAGGPYTAKVGESIAFNASASSDPDGDVLTFSWTFGDGRSRTGAQPSYAYDAAGTFTATVTVSDGHGGSNAASVPVTITTSTPGANRPPVAHAGGPYSGEADLPVTFNGSLSSDPDGDALVYAWSFSDGATATGKQVAHVFTTAQSHTATLTVTDVHQASAQATVTVPVSPRLDRAPPVAWVHAPREVLPGTDVTISATASDDVGVASVRIEVDGAGGVDLPSAPYQRTVRIPDVAAPGGTIVARAIARDAAGNAGSASVTMTIASQPDATPPTVSLSHAAETSPGAVLRLVAQAQDAVGVARVTFFINGAAAGIDEAAPYEFTYQVPANTPPGTTIAVAADAYDFAGNKGRAQGSVPVTGNEDTTPPALTFTAPAQVLAGTSIALNATATDAKGIAAVVFLVDGAVVATITMPPYQAAFSVPAGLPAGAHLALEARASDLSGLESVSSKDALVVPADAGAGLITGEVFDDTTGLPLSGVAVTLAAEGSAPAAATNTDDRGRFALTAPGGAAVVQIARAGWTGVERAVAVTAGSVTEIFDARLTPLNEAVNVTPVLGGTLRAGTASLTVPAGALAAATPMSLTRVGVHALHGLTPLGWAPLASYVASPAIQFAQPATLDIPLPAGLAAGAKLTLARWDPAATAWRAVAIHDVAAGETSAAAAVEVAGAYAWLRADTQPSAPPQPAAGELVTGVAPVAIGAAALATVTPQPKVIFYQPGVRSDVETRLTPGTPLPSGTPLQARITEQYQFRNDTIVQPESSVQDFAFFQSGAALMAAYPVTPSLTFEAATLKTGTISVEAITPKAAGGSAVVGAGGGHAETASGEAIDVAPESTSGTLAVQIDALAAASLGVAIPGGLTFVGGAAVTLAGGSLIAPASLSVPTPAGLDAQSQILLLKLVEIGGTTEYVLVGLGSVSGERVVSSFVLPKNKTPFEGVLSGGRYVFARAAAPLGFAAGQVIGADNAVLAGARVAVNDLKVIAISRPSGYIAAGKVGPLTVTALDLARSDAASVTGQLATAGDELAIDVRIVPQPLRVASIQPASGARNVPLSSPVTVVFSKPVDPASLTGANAGRLSLTSPAGPIAGTISLSAANTVVTFWPAALLDSNVTYTFTVAKEASDAAGRQMTAPATITFTAINTAPPPLPPAGSVTATIPAGGVTTVRGTQGTAGAHDTVWIENLTTGAVAPVLLDPNGGFEVNVAASRRDRLRLRIVGASGIETVYALPLFSQTNGDGSVTAAVEAEGGRVEGPNGTFVEMKPGTFPDGALVTIRSIVEAAFPVQMDTEQKKVFGYAGGVQVDFNGAAPAKYVNVGVAAAPGDAAADQWIVGQVVNAGGVQSLSVVDTAKLIDGRVRTSSPPCPGVTAAGVYGFYKSASTVGLNYALMSSSQYGGLRVDVTIPFMTSAFVFPFAAFSYDVPMPICFPVLSGRVTVVPNTQTVQIERGVLAPADREIAVRNALAGTEAHFARNILEMKFTVAGAAGDEIQVLLQAADGSRTPAPAVSVVADANDKLIVAIDADAVTMAIARVVVKNTTRSTETQFGAEQMRISLPVTGAADDLYIVSAIDDTGAARTLEKGTQWTLLSPNGPGNLLARAVEGTIDPTMAEILAYNASHPQNPLPLSRARTKVELINESRTPALVMEIPAARIVNGGFRFAFDGLMSDTFAIRVSYESAPQDYQRIPNFRIEVRNPITGRVVKTLTTQAPPRDEPLNLGTITDDEQAPMLIGSPARLDRFDPASPLTFTFSETMSPDSIKAAAVVERVRTVNGSSVRERVRGTWRVYDNGRTATFVPESALGIGEEYSVTFYGNDALNTTGQTVRDASGNAIATTRLAIRTFTPKLVSTLSVGRDGRLLEPIRHVTFTRKPVDGTLRTFLFATTESRTGYKLLSIDATNAEQPAEQQSAFGGQGKKRVTLVPDVGRNGNGAINYREPIQAGACGAGTQFAGDLAITTSSVVEYSYLSFFDVTRPDAPCLIGNKLLNATPDFLNDFTRPGTVHQMGFAEGVAWIRHSTGLAAYAAVREVGIMAADVGKNLPEPVPQQRLKEGIYPGDYWDVISVEDRLVAAERSAQRIDILDPNLAPLASVDLSDAPRRLLFAPAYGSDDDEDGIITPAEQRDLLFVAGTRSIQIVDLTHRTAPAVIGQILMKGTVRDLDFDPVKRRLFAGGTLDNAAGPGDGFFIIDVSKPLAAPIDADSDGWDDRVVYTRRYPQTMNGFRVDHERGLAYIPTYPDDSPSASAGPGRLDILAIYDNCCDLGIDFTRVPVAERPRGDRTSLLAKEKEALQTGIAAGLAKAAADCALPVQAISMIEQGSGACLWRGDCGSNYQPGVSDHDFEVFIPAAHAAAGACTVKALTDVFIDPRTSEPRPIAVGDGSRIAFEDITFFPVARELFETARFDVKPPSSGGSDAVGDMGLGRRSLLLKWLLEGAYVTGVPGFTLEGRSLDLILNDLKRVTGIPALEGYEWSNLQEYALAKSKAFVRVVGASNQDSGFHDLFVKQMHDAGKAGIRAAMARMVASPQANRILLDVTRDGYSRNACLAVVATIVYPDNWKEKPCTSFEEYIASAAARTLRGSTPVPLFSRDEVVNQIARFYKVKADLERIVTDGQADAFAATVAQFIARGKTETLPVYNQTIAGDPDSAQRTANLSQAQLNVQKALTSAKLALSPRVYNRGFRAGQNVRIGMYKSDAPGSGSLEKEIRQDVPGGDDRTISWERNSDGSLVLANGQAVPVFSLKVDQTAGFNQAHGVSFVIDLPDKSVKESNRQNNLGGFFYYVVDRLQPQGPATPARPHVPLPGGSLLDPDAACLAGAELSMSQVVTLDGAPLGGDATVAFGETLTITLTAQNLSSEPAQDVVVCSNITNQCYNLGLIGAGQSASKVVTFTAPSKGLIIDGAATVYTPSSGVIEGSTTRVVVGCENYAIVPLPYNPETSEVQMGGSAYRYYRIVNKRTGAPIANATVAAEVAGTFGSTFQRRSFTFTTGTLGEIQTGAETGLKLTPDSSWLSLIVGAEYDVTITSVNGVAPACTVPEKFTLTVKPRDYTLAYSRGTEIKGSAGLMFSVEGGVEAGTEIEKEVNGTAGDTSLSISQSFQTSGKFGVEFSLFKLKAGLGVGQVSGGAKVGTSDRAYAGKGVKLSFPYPLDEDKSCAIANLTLSGMFQVHPIFTKLIDLARTRPCADLTRYVTSTSTEFGHEANESAGVKLNFGRPAPGFGDADKEIGVDFGVSAANGFSIGAKNAFGYALSDAGALTVKSTTESYTLKGGIDFSAGLSLMPQDRPEEEGEKDKAGEAEVSFFKKSLDVNTSFSGNTSYSVAFTTDLSKLRDGLKPNSISIGYSGPKRWGWKRDLAGAETNLGNGFTGSYSYSLETPELVDKAIENLANLDTIHKASARTNMANQRLGLTPTLLNQELGTFSQVFYDTPIPYTVSREKGSGFTVPFGLEGEALGLKLGFGIDFKSESKVGWTREKGIRFRGRNIPLESYGDTEPAPADFGLWDTIRQTWKALLTSFATDFSDVQARIVRGAEQFVKLQSQFTATMMIDSTRLPDGTDVRLLSWRFTPATVPAKDYRYMPADSAGAADAPHYGIGGFHQFAPDGLDLGGPTSLVIDYHDQDVAGLDESTFAIYAWNSETGDWDHIGGTVDTAANTVTTTVTKFRLYTIGAAMPARAVTLAASGGGLIGGQESGKRRFTVTASGFVQNNGAAVPNGTMYTVRSAPQDGSALVQYGTILTADADPSTEGIQVQVTNGAATFEIEFNSPFGAYAPARAIIYSTKGTAFGETLLAAPAAGGGL
ncbi:MAG TPA: PKD domain-containing protein [Vicinamibacterales bacterium]|nr:PKD domain-containing protein [Vicinamibacterales bacterium]